MLRLGFRVEVLGVILGGVKNGSSDVFWLKFVFGGFGGDGGDFW